MNCSCCTKDCQRAVISRIRSILCFCGSKESRNNQFENGPTYDRKTVDLPVSGLGLTNDGFVEGEDSFSENEEPLPKVALALCDFDAGQNERQLSFRKDDRLTILNDSLSEWWIVRNDQTGNEGYVPSSYLVQECNIEANEWYHGEIKRSDAERLLQQDVHREGTFMIRKNVKSLGQYALSVKTKCDDRYSIAHYQIKYDHTSSLYIIDDKEKFASLMELVNFYSDEPYDSPMKLQTPCMKQKPHLWDLSQDTKDAWEIPREELRRVRMIGKGNYGEVWFGYWKNSVEVAIKSLKPASMPREDFLREASIMKPLRHDNLVPLYAVCAKEDPIWIISEYMPYGSLRSYLKGDYGRHLKTPILTDMSAQLADGMSYLEEHKLVHRDLAARNVLVGDNNIIKIADFGLARILTNDGIYTMSTASMKVPIKWTAPEVFLYRQYTVKSDVWSFGIVLTEIYTHGNLPYNEIKSKDVQEEVVNGYRMPCPEGCPYEIYQIMLQCWKKDAEERPTFATIRTMLEDYSNSA